VGGGSIHNPIVMVMTVGGGSCTGMGSTYYSTIQYCSSRFIFALYTYHFVDVSIVGVVVVIIMIVVVRW
jgi:hypothetical protein